MNCEELFDTVREIIRVATRVAFSNRQTSLLERAEWVVANYRLGYISQLEFCEAIEEICRKAIKTDVCSQWASRLEDIRWRARVGFVEALCR